MFTGFSVLYLDDIDTFSMEITYFFIIFIVFLDNYHFCSIRKTFSMVKWVTYEKVSKES